MNDWLSRPDAINPGQLRDQLRVESQPTGRDASGGMSLNDPWPTFANVFGRIDTLTGREQEQASKQWEDVTVQILIRSNEGIDPTMRVFAVDTGVYYDIRGIVPIGTQRRWSVLMCREHV